MFGVRGSQFDLVEIERPATVAQDLQVDGSFLRLSEHEGALQTSGAQRLLVRVLSPQTQALESAAEEIFRLSTVGHLSASSEPREQDFRDIAQAASPFLASRCRSSESKAWCSGSQQHWL